MKKLIALLCFIMIAALPASAQNTSSAENSCELDIHLEVPEFIEEGLVDGSMQRVGGVIIDSENQQTIAWLRQGGQIGQVAESSAGLLEHVIRLSDGANVALSRLLANLTPVLNISMAGFSLLEHIIGIRAHEAELERIYDRVSEEFQRDRRVELLAALDYAENTFQVTNDEYKWAAVAEVNSDLTVARKQLIEDLEILRSAEPSQENMELAMNYQVLAMRICTLGTRLRLEIGENEAAIDWLSQCVSEHKSHTRDLVLKLLGENRALFFHESISVEYFDRYLNIERWLRGKRDVLLEIVRESRYSFWNDDAISPLYVTTFASAELSNNPFYWASIPMSEVLIENYERLEGFEQELRSLEGLCLPTFTEWEAYDGETDISISEHNGYAMLVRTAFMDAGN